MSLHGLGVIGAQVTAASIKSNDEKHPETPRRHSPPGSVQSTPSINEGRSQEFDPSIGAKPYSPFYRHGTPTTSYEQLTFETKNQNQNPSHLRETENAGPYSALRNESPRRSKLWEEENQPRSWMQSLSNRQRMALKGVVAVVTVGSMIAVALGITAAGGGGAWKYSAEKAALD
jgi:hypothetical protein